MQTIPNPYLHFGDLDFAGIGIYLNEFKKHLGNRELYDNQKSNFDERDIENSLKVLIESIHEYKKGLEQEVLIKY